MVTVYPFKVGEKVTTKASYNDKLTGSNPVLSGEVGEVSSLHSDNVWVQFKNHHWGYALHDKATNWSKWPITELRLVDGISTQAIKGATNCSKCNAPPNEYQATGPFTCGQCKMFQKVF